MTDGPTVAVFAGSVRSGSLSGALAGHIARSLALDGASASLISLADYPLPIYDGDLEADRGVPEPAVRLHDRLGRQDAVVVVTPEYNQSLPPLLKNAIDWMSRVRVGEGHPSPWRGPVWALASSSPGHFAGYRALLHLRQVLEVGLGCRTLAEQVALPSAGGAFDTRGALTDPHVERQVARLVERLMAEAGRRR